MVLLWSSSLILYLQYFSNCTLVYRYDLYQVHPLYVSDADNPVCIYEGDEEEEKAHELIYLDEEEKPLVKNQMTMYLELNKTLSPEERNKYTFATILKGYKWSGRKWVKRSERKPFRGIIRVAHVSPANKKLHVKHLSYT